MGPRFISWAARYGFRGLRVLASFNVAQCRLSQTLGSTDSGYRVEAGVRAELEPLCRDHEVFVLVVPSADLEQQ